MITVQTMIMQEYQKLNRCWFRDEEDSAAWIMSERTLWMLVPLVMPLASVLFLTIFLLLKRRLNSAKWMLIQTLYATFFFVHVEVAF